MRLVTLCFLIDSERICLAMKKRGFGEGKWNGVGGKVEKGESVEEAAVRELHEEVGVRVHHAHLESVGVLEFSFEARPEWSQRMHIFFVRTWQHELKETDEMRPQWYVFSKIPYDDMWVGDMHWLPLVLEGRRINGYFHFTSDGSGILRQSVEG